MSESVISVEGIAKRFGQVVAVDDISFEVSAGTILGLLGPNGAGKTTTVRILTTILKPDRGRALVLGSDVVQYAGLVRTRIGLAGQYAAVDENLTGRENLRLIGQLSHQSKSYLGPRVDELLDRFSLSDAANRPVRTYSGGMRRRLDLAAALVHRPPVLFLDEPTTGLDPSGRSDLWEIIEQLVADGTTVLLTTQYLEEADRLADRIIVIDDGRIIAEGTSTELKSDLGNTIVEVRMSSSRDAARAANQLGAIGRSELLGDGRSVGVRVTDGGRSLLELVRVLDRHGMVPEWMTVREPTLDDVFLQLTGHRAEEPPSGTDIVSDATTPGQKRGAA